MIKNMKGISLSTKKFIYIRLSSVMILINISIESLSQKLITIPLNIINRNTSNIKFSDYMNNQEDNSNFRIPFIGSSDFFLKKYILNLGQSLYFRFLTGKLTQIQFDSLIQLNHIDTLNISKSIDNSTLYVFGKKINQTAYEFIPDLNFNKDFTDDEVFCYEIGGETIKFDIELEEVSNTKKAQRKYTVGLEINSTKVLIDSKADKIPLFITHFNSFSGPFFYKKKKYFIELFPLFLTGIPKNSPFFFMISQVTEKSDSFPKNSFLKKINETYDIDGIKFKINSFDLLNMKVTISVL